jgi:plastocyanin
MNPVLHYSRKAKIVRNISLSAGTIILLVVLAFVPGCKSDSTNPYGNTTAPPPTPNTVIMSGMTFSPATLTITHGATVTWSNHDAYTHTSTSDNAVWNTGNIAGGSSAAQLFSTAGTYHYHCTYHQAMGMVGTIIVQ